MSLRIIQCMVVVLLMSPMGVLGAKKSMFGETEPRNIGPAVMSGRVTDIAVPLQDDDIIYVGTGGGGVWKSENTGITFEPIFDDHPQSIGCVTIDPSDKDTIWVGTGEINTRNSVSYGAGLFRSTDGGESWKLMGFEDSERIAEVIVHPNDSNVVYVAVLGHLWGDSEERGLYKTTDGGKNWERLIYVDQTTGCIDVDLDPHNPDIVYAAMWQVRRMPYFFESGGPGSGLFKSTDGGKNFKQLSEGLPKGDLGRIDVDVAVNRPGRLYAIVEGEKNSGLYMSDDMGERWSMVNDDFNVRARPFYLSTVVVDPTDYKRVYNPSYQLAYSNDAGKTFKNTGIGVHADLQALWINPKNSDHVIAGTDGGLYISHNRGDDFRFVPNLPVSQFYRVSVDNAMPYMVYGGLQDNGSWKGPSAAAGGITNDKWIRLGGGDGFCVERDRKHPEYVYWESQGGNLNRLDEETGENRDIVPYPEEGMERNRFNWNSPLASSPTRPGVIYFGSQYVYRSDNQGDSWQRISPDLTTDDPEKQRQEESGGLTKDATSAENHCTIFTIAESGVNPKVIWAGTDDGNIQVTRNDGADWENVTGNIPDLPPNTWVSSVWPGSHQEGVVYATFDGHRHGDKNPYVYKSEDFGKTWKSLVTENIKFHCHVVRQDPVNPKLLFLGTESGLYVSLDDGTSWTHFTEGLPPVSIRDMAFQQREKDLVLGTHGRGIYIFDDLTPIRALTEETLAQNFAMLPSRPPIDPPRGNSPGNQGGNWFAAGNPSQGLNINYYLKKRHLFGDIYLEVLNEKGELVKKLPAGNRPGINRIFWSMREKPPKAPRSRMITTLLRGPRIPDGTYTVRLVKGKKSAETTVDVKPGPGNKHSAEDRAANNQALRKLYLIQDDLTFLTTLMQDMMEQIKDRSKKAENEKLKASLDKKQEEVQAFYDTIISPSDNVFVDQFRLREDVVNLYGAISFYDGRPSTNQVDQIDVLERRFKESVTQSEPLLKVEKLNKALAKNKLDPIVVLTREAWEKQQEESGSGTMSPASFAPFFH